MIYVPRPPIPQLFELSQLRLNQQQRIDADLIDWNERRPPLPTEIPGFLSELVRLFHNKCVFCETPFVHERYIDLAFFRPPRDARQSHRGALRLAADAGAEKHPHCYRWLIWQWTNLYPACVYCNRSKKSDFPIEHERAGPRVYGQERLYLLEKPLLLDPCLENPAHHLTFSDDGSVMPLDESVRSAVTIDLLALNRPELCQARRAEAEQLEAVYQQALQRLATAAGSESGALELLALCDDDQPYAGLRRQLVQQWLDATIRSRERPAMLRALLEQGAWQQLRGQLDRWRALEPLRPALINILPDGALDALAAAAGIIGLPAPSGRHEVRVEQLLVEARRRDGLAPIDQWLAGDARTYLLSPRPALTRGKPIRKRRALLIGANRYLDLTIGDLNYCIKDVEALQMLLQAHGYEVLVLSDERPDTLRPLRANIRSALRGLVQDAEEDDLLFVHFSGHGALWQGKPFLLPHDARRADLDETALPLTEVEQILRSGKAQRIVMTLDACHVGASFTREVKDYEEFVRQVYDLARGYVVLAASTAEQFALEDKEKEHGAFTYYLLEALQGSARRADNPFITVDDVRHYVLYKLRSNARQQGGYVQEPTTRNEGMGDMILIDNRKAPE